MRRSLTNPRIWIAVLVVAGLLAVALWPQALPVETGPARRGPLVVTIDEEGETRVRARFVVSAPVAGRVLRIALEPGDQVKRGDVVARLRPEDSPLLDARTRAETREALDAARAAVGRARADEQQARTQLARVTRELARTRVLLDSGASSRQQLDTAEADAQAAEEAVRAASFAVQAAEADVRRAEARLAPATGVAVGGITTVRAPVDGVVLRRVRESESVVPAGDPLLELGDPSNLEIVSDFLSSDAIKVRPGQRAIVEDWGGDHPLEARVRRVEPAGFTKVSALGVEEQRVNIVFDFGNAGEAVRALGDAYRVEIRVVLWESESTLTVPTSALFRQGSEWAVYVVVDGRARVRTLMLGQRTGQDAEVREGVEEGELVVLHPTDALAEGVRVAVTSSP